MVRVHSCGKVMSLFLLAWPLVTWFLLKGFIFYLSRKCGLCQCPNSQSSLQPAKTHSPGVVLYERQWGGLGPSSVLTLVVIRLIASTCGSFANINFTTCRVPWGCVTQMTSKGFNHNQKRGNMVLNWCQAMPYNIDKNSQCIVMLLRRYIEIWGKAVILLKKCHSVYDIWRTCLNIYPLIYNIYIYWYSDANIH